MSGWPGGRPRSELRGRSRQARTRGGVGCPCYRGLSTARQRHLELQTMPTATCVSRGTLRHRTVRAGAADDDVHLRRASSVESPSPGTHARCQRCVGPSRGSDRIGAKPNHCESQSRARSAAADSTVRRSVGAGVDAELASTKRAVAGPRLEGVGKPHSCEVETVAVPRETCERARVGRFHTSHTYVRWTSKYFVRLRHGFGSADDCPRPLTEAVDY